MGIHWTCIECGQQLEESHFEDLDERTCYECMLSMYEDGWTKIKSKGGNMPRKKNIPNNFRGIEDKFWTKVVKGMKKFLESPFNKKR